MGTAIQYCSDLHLEVAMNAKWMNKRPIPVCSEILLLGGDILPINDIDKYSDFLNYISDNFKLTCWIPGNHEYYGSDILKGNGQLYEQIRPNIILANNHTISIANVDIFCSTLWSNINTEYETAIMHALTDFKRITYHGERYTTEHWNSLHRAALQYLTSAINSSTATSKIVLSHHLPTYQSYPAKFKNSPYREAFATELSPLIEKLQVSHWIYGHSHGNAPSFTIGNTQLHTNQLGYVTYGENRHFDRSRILRLD